MVDRAKRWKFAWQQSPLAASPQEVKDGVEDGTKVGVLRQLVAFQKRFRLPELQPPLAPLILLLPSGHV